MLITIPVMGKAEQGRPRRGLNSRACEDPAWDPESRGLETSPAALACRKLGLSGGQMNGSTSESPRHSLVLGSLKEESLEARGGARGAAGWT